MTPILSVVIPAYNVEGVVLEAIRSVQNQSLQELEIIVVDDGSIDGTRQIVESLDVDPRLRLICQGNLGPSGSRNTALYTARGKYIGFLDGDDRWHKEKALRHIEILEQNPDIDMTFSGWRIIDGYGIDTGRGSRPAQRRIQFEDLLKENMVGPASTVIARRAAIERAGLFDPDLRAAVDLDLWLRIAWLRKSNIACIPDVLTDYRLRPGQITKDWRRMARNWERVIEKARSTNPSRVCAIEGQARANFKRYLAYLAYEASDYASARKLLLEALSSPTFNMLLDKRTWITTIAVLCTLLPKKAHNDLAAFAKNIRARVHSKSLSS